MVRVRDQVIKSNIATSLRDRVARIRAVNEAEMVIAVEQQLPPKGTPITMNRAVVKYGVSQPTVANWVRYGFVTVLKPGKGQGSSTDVDEYDVAKIIATQDVSQGKRTKPPS